MNIGVNLVDYKFNQGKDQDHLKPGWSTARPQMRFGAPYDNTVEMQFFLEQQQKKKNVSLKPSSRYTNSERTRKTRTAAGPKSSQFTRLEAVKRLSNSQESGSKEYDMASVNKSDGTSKPSIFYSMKRS